MIAAFALVACIAAQDAAPAPSLDAAAAPAPDAAPARAPDAAPGPVPGESTANDASEATPSSAAAQLKPREASATNARAENAAWTVAGATAAGFVGGALLAVPFMTGLIGPLGIEVALAVGLPTLALGAAFGALIAELGSARFSTSLAVSGIAGGGALLGTAGGMVAGFGVGSLAQSKANDPAPLLGAIVGGALGGIGVGALSGGLGALWLTPDER